MIKKLVVAIAILAALWMIEPVRARIILWMTPLLERLDPWGERLLTPAKVYATKNDLAALVRLVASERNEMRPLPTQQTFRAWAQRKWGEDPIDHWGQLYWIRQTRNDGVVGSNGPDRQRGTADDVTHVLPPRD